LKLVHYEEAIADKNVKRDCFNHYKALKIWQTEEILLKFQH